MVLDGERPQAVVKWLAAFDNRREKRGAKASKRVQFCQLAKLMFDADGNVGEGSKKFLQGWVDAYVGWVKKHI